MLGKFLVLALVCLAVCSGAPANYTKGGKDWTGFCKNGTSQSPIAIEFSRSFLAPYNSGSLTTHFTSVNATGNFTDGGLCLDAVNFGSIDFFTSEYNYAANFSMICFFAPSQHKIGEKSFPLEVTLVSSTDMLGYIGTAVSFLFKKSSSSNKFIQEVMNVTKGVVGQQVNLNDLVGENVLTNFYNYKGSVPVPPCTEGVNWFVAGNSQYLSGSQIEFFTSHWAGNKTFAKGHGNNRNVQKYHGRQVYLYRDL